MTTRRGGCHCGAVRFEAEGELEGLEVCNCSICLAKAYVHWYVPRERFRLLSDPDAITTYRFGTGKAEHRFCATCGVAPFYVPRSDPDKIDVNVRCLDGMTLAELESLPATLFDGEHWEESFQKLRGRGGDGSIS
ncbi:MAG TPA: GFA family protein [Myxococcota bacterium]|nr:GFA family protein [Myxococcota bacterium]